MKIASFVTYQKGNHRSIALATLETATGETLTKTIRLSEHSEDSGKAPAYPADRWLKSADYLVRYTDDTLFSWLEGERIMLDTQRKVLEFRKFIGLELGDEHIPTITFDDSAVDQELDLSLGVENGIRERFESLTDHLTGVKSGWEKGCLSLCMLAFVVSTGRRYQRKKQRKQRQKHRQRNGTPNQRSEKRRRKPFTGRSSVGKQRKQRNDSMRCNESDKLTLYIDMPKICKKKAF